MIGQISAALHVVDARTEGAVSLYPERQALDKSDRVHRIEMTENKNPGRILPPSRTRQEMIATSGMSSQPLNRHRQIAIAVRHYAGELVDLRRRFRRRLDFHPAADAVEDGHGIKRVGGRHAVLVELS